MLLLTAVAAFLLVPAVRILRVWQSFGAATVSVRVTSSGTVRFGNEEVPVEECLALLASSEQSLRSHGLRPDLSIEGYSNTKQSDVETVLKLGKKAGFESV
jgi:biopolymer transport protein ExbD